MNSEVLRQRTMQFSLRVIRFIRLLPRNTEGFVLGKQLLRSSTSMTSNYRAACLSRSREEFYSKLCIVVEETDEAMFWLEMIKQSELTAAEELSLLINESKELLYIFSKSRKSTRENLIKTKVKTDRNN